MDKIVRENSIWDLHIHTNQCPKGSGEFSKMDTKKYVDNLLEIFSSHDDLTLISFTDHNQISYDVYKEFSNRKTSINLLPGIEVDVVFPEDIKTKHVIFYFDKKIDDEFEIFSRDINNFLKNGNVDIFYFLNFLISKKIDFVISPHAFKQSQKAIDSDWNDEIKVEENAHKYLDQFYCFWEAGGHSEISRAVEFLKDFLISDRISIISFSDSADSKKLTKFLNNPTQYFKTLPSFKGLQLVATDCNRISDSKIKINDDSKGNLIGKIKFNNQEIYLSDRLNTIIGGRGSGKSLLIDALYNKLLPDNRIAPKRKKFIAKYSLELYNFNGEEIKSDSFQVDYYEQAYVSKIFNSDNYSEEIEKYFYSAFEKIEDINEDITVMETKEAFSNMLSKYNEFEKENISSLISKYRKEIDEKLKLPLKKNNIVKFAEIEIIDNSQQIEALNSKKIMPKELIDNPRIEEAIKNLQITIAEESQKYNFDNYIKVSLKNNLINEYFKYKQTISDISANKQKVEKQLLDGIAIKEIAYMRRINMVNAIIQLQINFKSHYENVIKMDGMNKDAFCFKKEIEIESPIEYLVRKLSEYYSTNKLGYRIDLNSALDVVKEYCYYGDLKLKDSKNIDDLDKELKELSLELNKKSNIYYKDDKGEYKNIMNYSPGTQTNILMEYIVNKQTDIPLLIDQPEDNIDNYTIYKKLKKWFVELKNKRQIIVVTHDANIAINADSENLIIAKQVNSNEFEYDYGALEYNRNLEIASNVLDGGKEAVKRRMLKYGE